MNEINFRINDINEIKMTMDVGVKEIYPPIENLEVTPTKEQQVFTHENSYGYDKVEVNAIPEEYIIPDGTLPITENTTYDVRRFAKVTASVHPTPNLQNKSITITENGTQSIVADEEYEGLKSLEVTTNVKSASNEVKNLEELNNAIIGCVDNLLSYQTKYINQYECDSDEAVTLYTPVEGFNHYITRYRNNGYQVLWFADRMIKERNSQNVTELNTRRALVYSFEFDTNDKVGISDGVTSTYADGQSTAYISPTYLTLEELFNAMQDRTTIYTKANNANWGCDNRTPTLAPYTNMVYFDSSDNMVMKKRISSNEKIEVQ